MKHPSARRSWGVAFLALLALAAAAVAQDPKKDPTPDEKLRKSYEGRRRDDYAAAAAAHVDAAEFCYGKKLYQVSLLEYGLALALDPENAKARERLGFKKKDGKWEDKPSGPVKRSNECPPNEVNNITSEYNERIKKSYAKVADRLFELGKWCRERKLEEEARAAWNEALGFNTDHAKAREALGFKKDGDKWVSAGDREAADAMKKKVAGAKEGEASKEDTEEDKAIGSTLEKRKSAHFLLQGPFSQEELKEWIKLAETVFEDFHTLFGVPMDKPVVGDPVKGTLLDTEEQHKKYVDACMDGSPGQKEWFKKGGGEWDPTPPRFEGWKGSGGKDEIADLTAHFAVHVLFHYYMGAGEGNVHPWLYECMAYTFTVRLRRSALTHCITQSTGGGAKGDMPHDAGNWKEATKDSVRKHEDPPIDRMLRAGINSIQGDLLLKGWSMIDWWLATRKEAFFKFLALMKEAAVNDTAQMDAWKAAFGQTPEESEAEWQKWVLSNY